MTTCSHEVYGMVYGTYAWTLGHIITMTERTIKHSKQISPELKVFHNTAHRAWNGYTFTDTEEVDTALKAHPIHTTTTDNIGLQDLGRVIVALKHYIALLMQHKNKLKRGLGKRLVDYANTINQHNQDTLCTEAFTAENARQI